MPNSSSTVGPMSNSRGLFVRRSADCKTARRARPTDRRSDRRSRPSCCREKSRALVCPTAASQRHAIAALVADDQIRGLIFVRPAINLRRLIDALDRRLAGGRIDAAVASRRRFPRAVDRPPRRARRCPAANLPLTFTKMPVRPMAKARVCDQSTPARCSVVAGRRRLSDSRSPRASD